MGMIQLINTDTQTPHSIEHSEASHIYAYTSPIYCRYSVI